MGRLFTNPDHHRAARAVVAAVTAAETEDPEDLATLAEDLLDGLTEFDVLAGAGIILDRVVTDVCALLRMDRAETLERIGTWVALDEFAS